MARQVQAIAFRHVRIFDGLRILPYDTLVLQGDTITAIGDETVIPPQAEIINGAGQTLLPGFIDCLGKRVRHSQRCLAHF